MLVGARLTGGPTLNFDTRSGYVWGYSEIVVRLGRFCLNSILAFIVNNLKHIAGTWETALRYT